MKSENKERLDLIFLLQIMEGNDLVCDKEMGMNKAWIFHFCSDADPFITFFFEY